MCHVVMWLQKLFCRLFVGLVCFVIREEPSSCPGAFGLRSCRNFFSNLFVGPRLFSTPPFPGVALKADSVCLLPASLAGMRRASGEGWPVPCPLVAFVQGRVSTFNLSTPPPLTLTCHKSSRSHSKSNLSCFPLLVNLILLQKWVEKQSKSCRLLSDSNPLKLTLMLPLTVGAISESIFGAHTVTTTTGMYPCLFLLLMDCFTKAQECFDLQNFSHCTFYFDFFLSFNGAKLHFCVNV